MTPSEFTDSNTLKKVSTHDIKPSITDIRAVFCVRNEKFRLQFFLDYYRRLGVSEFFAVDNNSDDDTLAFLLEQPDVHVFHTNASYKESNAGRDWTTELTKQYFQNSWCLTLDVDEFFVYPFIEEVSLPVLCNYMDKWGYQGIFSIFLDFYSSGPLSKAQYTESQSPFDICDHFDTASSYSVYETPNFPFLQINGGIRQRKFWDSSDVRSGPSMRKLVLVKWNDDFEYLHSTHSCTSIKLADITTALAHFKFLSHFKDFSKLEVKRNDRVANSSDWKVYAKALEKEDVCFFDSALSRKYKDSFSLLEDGHISCSLRYYDHVSTYLRKSQLSESVMSRDEMLLKKESSYISYQSLNKIWPGVGLFSQNFGSNHRRAQDVFRIEEDINALISSRFWRMTYWLRKSFARLGLCDQRSIPEEMSNQNTYSRFAYTYKSIWWEMTGSIRAAIRIFKKLIFRLKCK